MYDIFLLSFYISDMPVLRIIIRHKGRFCPLLLSDI